MRAATFLAAAALALGPPAPVAGQPTGWAPLDAHGAVRHSALGLFPDAAGGGMTPVIGRVAKHSQPLFVQDRPWEPRLDNGYPNVVYDASSAAKGDGPWRLWYGGLGQKIGRGGQCVQTHTHTPTREHTPLRSPDNVGVYLLAAQRHARTQAATTHTSCGPAPRARVHVGAPWAMAMKTSAGCSWGGGFAGAGAGLLER